MKNIFWALSIALALSCSNAVEAEQQTETIEKEASTIVDDFLRKTSSLEKIESSNPIERIQEVAEKVADHKVVFNKRDIQSLLEVARDYSGFFIIVENHSIVKIEDLDNCNPSGSWNACMPFGEGYIKKGELVLQEDYINNIIGLPDSQKRIAYFFK
tara:strand:- start:2 stop:472 length:471 start_codon:yes stop_codon:yes gene_type:complete